MKSNGCSAEIMIKKISICTVGSPSLPVLLQLLTAQTRRLIYTEEAQNLLHRLSMSIIHHYGGRRRREKTQQYQYQQQEHRNQSSNP